MMEIRANCSEGHHLHDSRCLACAQVMIGRLQARIELVRERVGPRIRDYRSAVERVREIVNE